MREATQPVDEELHPVTSLPAVPYSLGTSTVGHASSAAHRALPPITLPSSLEELNFSYVNPFAGSQTPRPVSCRFEIRTSYSTAQRLCNGNKINTGGSGGKNVVRSFKRRQDGVP